MNLLLLLLLTWSYPAGEPVTFNVYEQDVPLKQPYLFNPDGTYYRGAVLQTTDALKANGWVKVATVRANKWTLLTNSRFDIIRCFVVKSCNYPDEP